MPGGLADPDNDVAAGSSESTRDKASSDSSSSRGNLGDSDLDTASGDGLSCSDTDEISVRTACKKYRKESGILQVKQGCGLDRHSNEEN